MTTQDPLILQLSRVRGQIDGLIAMYESDRGCIEIVRQIMAARSGLGKVARELLSGEAGRCSSESRMEDLQEVLREVFRN